MTSFFRVSYTFFVRDLIDPVQLSCTAEGYNRHLGCAIGLGKLQQAVIFHLGYLSTSTSTEWHSTTTTTSTVTASTTPWQLASNDDITSRFCQFR